MKQAAIIYDSKTGNTEKVALAISDGLQKGGLEVLVEKVETAQHIDFFDYDLICIGSPSYMWHPLDSIKNFLTKKHENYRSKGLIKLGSPKVSGKHALPFCTYSGPHTGIAEAIPVCKIIGQFFDHLGFNIVGEWCILGELHASEEISTKGRMGDIRGRPNLKDLEKVRNDSEKLASSLS
ncbi:MAG: flavodoxin domain-containing protein [Candidatus Bathyarchaeota archaeon]|nr:flavodoxin domain-containing protein [Candidatus Bathyarchaeota archaeon]